jgi:hypothetical protein
LATNLVKKGLKLARINTSELLNGINLAVKDIEAHIEVKEKTSIKDLRNIANISLNYNPELARLIVNAVEASGDYGLITIEKSNLTTSSLEKKEGYSFICLLSFSLLSL